MNSLVDKFGDKLAVLAVPCNQFGHQTNEDDAEFLNTLKYVRPGNNFEPKMDIFAKTNVNGATAHPLFKWARPPPLLRLCPLLALVGARARAPR
jgi:glutathione peroxidase